MSFSQRHFWLPCSLRLFPNYVIVTFHSLPWQMFCVTTFSLMIDEGNGRGLIKVITRHLLAWLRKVAVNLRTICVQAETGLDHYCHASIPGHILMYHWLCVPVSCTAQVVHTAAGRTRWIVLSSFASSLNVATGITDLALLQFRKVWCT